MRYGEKSPFNSQREQEELQRLNEKDKEIKNKISELEKKKQSLIASSRHFFFK